MGNKINCMQAPQAWQVLNRNKINLVWHFDFSWVFPGFPLGSLDTAASASPDSRVGFGDFGFGEGVFLARLRKISRFLLDFEVRGLGPGL